LEKEEIEMRKHCSLMVAVAAMTITVGGHARAQEVDLQRLWFDVAGESLPPGGRRIIIPIPSRTVALDRAALDAVLAEAPMEKTVEARERAVRLSLPLPDGSFSIFRIEESPVMAPELSAKYPKIRTYSGKAEDVRAWSVRCDATPAGFHAMIFTPSGTVFIDPYRQADTVHYSCYYRKDLLPDEARSFQCEGAIDDIGSGDDIDRRLSLGGTLSGSQLRTYRLAVATTGEYTAFHGGTVAAGMAAVVTAVNRVVGVYEKEVAVRMVLVAHNDTLIYTNASTDPYTNSSGSTMLGQNQTTIDAIIGSGNYDVGHVFSTGGGGIAGLGVVCRAGNKARGVTGLSSPIGDPFYIDYVAHEMGHQFGGNHTFNGTAGSCGGGNRSAANAYEPGSGTTIMAYAGICGAHNTQNNSDAYFHGRSIDEVVTYTTAGSGNSCPVVTATGNLEPAVSVPPGGFTIPKSTPFTLTGSAIDPDGDSMTYCWEEFDLGAGGDPNAPVGNAPIFRSFLPVAGASRTFPKLSNILGNTQTIGELLPAYGRTLTFRLTARDNRGGGGGVGKATTTFSVTDSAGPFLVTFPNTAMSFIGGGTCTVTWNVAGTDVPPVNCSAVNILISTNGGNSFPITLAAGTPNDGSEQVILPSLATVAARIKVEAAGNVFFDLSNVNFTITSLIAPPLLLPAADAIEDPAGVVLLWQSVNGATGYRVQLGTDPALVTGLVINDSLVTDTTYAVTGLDSSTAYYWRVSAANAGGPGAWSAARRFSSAGPVPAAPSPVLPVQDSLVHTDSLLVVWQSSRPAVLRYWLEWSVDSTFAVTSLDSTLSDTSRVVRTLQDSAVYYWRVRAKNLLGWGPASTVGRFSTLFTIQVCVALQPAWQMIALPVHAADDSVGTAFPPCGSGCAFRYVPGAGYQGTCVLEPGTGYWVKCTGGTVCATGVAIERDSVFVQPGWNLIGSVSFPLSASLAGSTPPGIINSPFYTFGVAGYTPAESLEPGRGYWVRVSEAGVLILEPAAAGVRRGDVRAERRR
jgi:hypothetical protein